MQQESHSFLSWYGHLSTQQACLEELNRHRWSNGFVCQCCGHDQAYVLSRHTLHQCGQCKHQTSVTAGIYLMSADKDESSATRLAQMVGVVWRMRKLKQVMGDRDQTNRLRGLVEVDDAFVSGKHSGKRRRGQKVKHRRCWRSNNLVKVAVIWRPKCSNALITNKSQSRRSQRSDAYFSRNILNQRCEQLAKVTSSEQAPQ